MDPQRDYDLMVGNMEIGEWHEAAKHARALIAWIKAGGLPPEGVTLEAVETALAEATVEMNIEAEDE